MKQQNDTNLLQMFFDFFLFCSAVLSNMSDMVL